MIEAFYWIAVVLAWLHLAIVIVSLIVRHKPKAMYDGTALPNAVVIIPTYNEQRTIRNTLLTWHTCSPRPKEIIVVDDGSADDTVTLVTALKRKMPILNLVARPHEGKARALNYALRQVDSDIVIVSDSDTIPSSDIMINLLGPFTNPSVAAVSADRRTIPSHPLGWLFDLEHIAGANLTRHIGNLWDSQTGVSGALSAFRKSSLLAVGGFPEDRLSDDTAVTLRIQDVGSVVYVPRALAYTTPQTASQATLEQHRRWLLGTLQAILPYAINLRDHSRVSFGLAYFFSFRLLLPLIIPFADYFVLILLVTQHWSEAVLAMTLYLFPSTLTGIIAFFLDRYTPTALILLPVAQIIVRQYSMFLLLYVVFRAIVRAPLRWR